MKGPFKIHKTEQKIYLSTGLYSVIVLGGWNVKINEFYLLLRNLENDKVIKPEKAKWRFQSYAFKKRAKKIFVLDILYSGNYFIEFKKPEELKVRRSNFFLTKLFENEMPNDDLEICIE